MPTFSFGDTVEVKESILPALIGKRAKIVEVRPNERYTVEFDQEHRHLLPLHEREFGRHKFRMELLRLVSSDPFLRSIQDYIKAQL